MRFFPKLFGGFFVFMTSMLSLSAFADEAPRFNMHYGVTPMSRDIYDLHMLIFGICVIIGIIVFSILTYALIKHRKSKDHKPAQFHEHQTLEILWAIIPLLILIVMAIPATLVLMRMSNAEDSGLTIKITGYQWKWQYEYLDQGVKFFSVLKTPLDQINNKAPKDKWYLLEVDKPMVVPIHEKIRFLITSNDVIHSWWVPSLGVKKDAIPGFIHEAWAKIDKPGIYRGQCAELCGVYHGYMPIVVKAVTEEEFQKWVAQQNKAEKEQVTTDAKADEQKKYSAEDLMKLGKANYDKNCAVCHGAEGQGIPPIYPALHADSVAVGGSISRHIDIVLNGVPGSAMQAFGPQLTNLEIASIITYERNAWENNTGDVVQPSDIAKQREKYAKQKQAQEEAIQKKDVETIKIPKIIVPTDKNND